MIDFEMQKMVYPKTIISVTKVVICMMNFVLIICFIRLAFKWCNFS